MDEHLLSQKEIQLSKHKKIKIQKIMKKLLVKMEPKNENNEKTNHEMRILIQRVTQIPILETSERNQMTDL